MKIMPKRVNGGTKQMNKHRITEEIMDLRDYRIKLQRKVAMLEEKALWEPNAFSEEDAYWLRYYRADVARIKATEEELRHRIA